MLTQPYQSLLRFPGGNMLEGSTNKTWWDWKDTLGPLRYRKGFEGVWDYQQTHGLGLVEYLEWAEDMQLEIGKIFFFNTTRGTSNMISLSGWRVRGLGP